MKINFEFESLAELETFLANGINTQAQKKTPLHGLGLTIRAENCLLGAGIAYIEDAQRLGRTGLLRLPNVGRTIADEILDWKPSYSE